MRSCGFIVALMLTTAFAGSLARAEPPRFRPMRIALPDNAQLFTGDNSEAINNNCLACHSAEMILNQPGFARPVWEAEVRKMIATYKAPVAPQDVAPIVDYLCNLKCPKP